MIEPMYYARKNSNINDEQAQKYGERISKLQEKNNDIVTPQIVVDDARKKSSPLHNYFEWSDDKAAIEFRKAQARYLIAAIKIEVVVNDEKETSFVRAFHRVTVKDNGHLTGGYAKFEFVQQDEKLYDEFILKRYLAEIKRLNDEYKIYKELEPLTSAIDKMLEDHTKLMEVV